MKVGHQNIGRLAQCMILSLFCLLIDHGGARAQQGIWPSERDAYGQGQQRRDADVRKWERRSERRSPQRTVIREVKPASADGRLTLRNYVSGDNSETYKSPTVILSFLEADLHLKDLTEGGLRLDLDSTFILDVSQPSTFRTVLNILFFFKK